MTLAMKNSGLTKIVYEFKIYEVDEEEFDHYHLKQTKDDKFLPPIYKNEIIKILSGIGYSKYSVKKQQKRIDKNITKCIKFMDKIINAK